MSSYIAHISQNDNIMKNIIKDVGKCLIGKNKQSPFAYFIGLIIGQKIKFSMARQIRSNLYTETSYDFTPQDILNLTENQWDKIQLCDDRKKMTIIKAAQYFVDNYINPNNITSDDISDLHEISGIGIWTVSTFMIEYKIDENLFPLNDKYVNKKLKELYKVNESDIEQFVEKWNPYKSYAFWYLWKYDLPR
jgi:DNA-3-methyladenine glycosylase II